MVAACTMPAAAATLVHTVVAGDTLWTIARANDVSVAKLEALNHLTDDSILQIGESVVVDRPRDGRHFCLPAQFNARGDAVDRKIPVIAGKDRAHGA